ncbi:RadC family protein [Garciella nitratireducens]|uniref:DNA replication and repair protein RadC n=1 Tax=Garciella nitratireducens DSM 15102 TaxID=1121911 RepID=A0A1T4K9D3_9FIRM|nr:DNA repair protein RadC [Garciella nitratireducens]RBP46715.1 DNA replication and repair protein RadC [Garciella nitratireducens]SJZ39058.1 DNA replication and repair protein RadC [Garciella nitratireducens DSM 15102]
MDGKGKHMTIKEFPIDERPREKLIKYGEKNLSDAELLAIILRTGSKDHTAISLAHYIIKDHKEGIRYLYNATIEEMSSIKGIGIAKATQIKAAIELGRRLSIQNPVKFFIKSPLDVVDYLMEEMRYCMEENFNVVLLDTKNRVISVENITKGIVNASLVHPREVFKIAIRKNSTSVILVHNHPSGDPTPSKEDRAITIRLIKAGEIIGIHVLDHIIIGDGHYLSFKESDML